MWFQFCLVCSLKCFCLQFATFSYSKLADYLWSGEWKKADDETANLMIQVAGEGSNGYLDQQAIEKFPCSDLRIIDFLWVYASKGYFGFSVQKNIYQSLGGTSKYDEKVWKDFVNRVGWTNKKIYTGSGRTEFTLDSKAEACFPHRIHQYEQQKKLCDFPSLASRLVNCNM
ncbi:GUN4 domain-containing protein [Aetokthonos hydrillicola CCALA 1050]|nr:GUN4 domain-containing protein [Aetokthonos hydrillicola CCALA 1050]